MTALGERTRAVIDIDTHAFRAGTQLARRQPALAAQLPEYSVATATMRVHVAAAPREFDDGRPLVKFADTPREWFPRSVEVNGWAMWDLAKCVAMNVVTTEALIAGTGFDPARRDRP